MKKEDYFERQLRINRNVFILAICMVLAIFALSMLTGCRKDYAEHASPYHTGDLVRLNGIDPEHSPIPHGGGIAPLRIDTAYLDKMYPLLWFYNTTDAAGVKLEHVDNKQLKKY